MGYVNWATRYRYAIEATSAITSAAGILFIAAGLGISIASLITASRAQDVATAAFEESKRATQAQTLFAIQKFGFGVLKEVTENNWFMSYMFNGPDGLTDEQQELAANSYYLLLTGYNVIFTQWTFGYIPDPEWELYKQEVCGVVISNGGQHFFKTYNINESIFDEAFQATNQGLSGNRLESPKEVPMRKVRLVVVAIALMTITSTPTHAFFIFQHTVNPDQELRQYGGEVLGSIAELYSRISLLERGDMFDEAEEFRDLGERLQGVAEELDVYIEDVYIEDVDGDRNADIEIDRLRENHEDMYEKIQFTYSDRSYTHQLLARHDLKLELPTKEQQVFVQASRVIRILANTISEASLRGQGGDINDVKRFQQLNETVLVLIDILSLHSILLSTTR